MHRTAPPASRILVVLLALAVPGCEKLGVPPRGAEGQAGYPVYSRACAACHGHDGSSARASRIARERVDLRDLAGPGRRVSRERVADIVRRGEGRMDGLEDKLTDAEIQAVSSYVLWLAAAADTPAGR